MREVWPSILLAFPVTLYVGAVVLESVPASDGLFSGMFVALFLLAVLAALPVEPLRLWAPVAQLVLTGVMLGALYLASGWGVELLAGSILASPALLVSYSVRPGAPGWRLFGFALALTEGLGLLAVTQTLTAAGVVVTGREFVHEFISLFVTQGAGLYGLLASSGGALPLRDFFDPDYVVLAAIAAAGLLFTSLRPQTAWGELLPAPGGTPSPPPIVGAPSDVGPELAAVLADRSSPEPAEDLPPGLPSLLGGGIAAALMVGVAFFSPGITLVMLAAGVVVALGITIGLMLRPRPPRR